LLVAIGLAILLIVSSTLAVVEYSALGNQMSSYQSTLSKQDSAIIQLDTALNFSQAVMSTKQPVALQYLTTLPESNSGGNPTEIFLLSTTIGYSYEPNLPPFNETLRNALTVPLNSGSINLPDFGWQYVPGNYSYFLMSGAPYLMIGATIRNDYTSADAANSAGSSSPIGNLRGVYLSYLSLTVRLYSRDGSVIQATNLNVTYAPENSALGNQEFISESSMTTQVMFYISPANLNIDHYEIYVSYLSASPQT